MGVYERAQREVELYKKDRNYDEDGYIMDIYDSALKAFKYLCEDGHSGSSIGLTLNVLTRFVKGLPLTYVTEETAEWKEIESYHDDVIRQYRSDRISGFYKYVRLVNGEEVFDYNHLDRIVCVNINNPASTYYSGLVNKLFNELHPIKMPYYPLSTSIKVYCEDFLYDKSHGDFDTVGVFYAIYPDGTIENINRFFHYGDNKEKLDITRKEYEELRKNKYK